MKSFQTIGTGAMVEVERLCDLLRSNRTEIDPALQVIVKDCTIFASRFTVSSM